MFQNDPERFVCLFPAPIFSQMSFLGTERPDVRPLCCVFDEPFDVQTSFRDLWAYASSRLGFAFKKNGTPEYFATKMFVHQLLKMDPHRTRHVSHVPIFWTKQAHRDEDDESLWKYACKKMSIPYPTNHLGPEYERVHRFYSALVNMDPSDTSDDPNPTEPVPSTIKKKSAKKPKLFNQTSIKPPESKIMDLWLQQRYTVIFFKWTIQKPNHLLHH